MKYTSFLLLAVLHISSCKKPEEYPVEPIIAFKNIYSSRNQQGNDDKITILLNFTDGDGDVGYKAVGQNDPVLDDPNSEYYRNYQAKLFQYTNNEWIEVPTIIPLGGRLPYLTPETKNKALKGEIACDLDVPPGADQDTFRLEIFIYDRALHKSNTEITSSIILNTL